ncbi:unnamed protein product [Ilex paraguariensis]|uniref:H15 domain-containing protein n=1 Tax=Ilex paraguariensis TaxID=185542 RepID=A0ABC8RJN6_9AQUA
MALAKKVTKKPSNASSATLHPPYFQMITEAITSLKDRTGSSQPAIAKFVEEKYPKQLPPNFKKMLSVQLKKFVKSEKLVKVKNSYKVSTSEMVKVVSVSAKETQKKKDGKKVSTTGGTVPKKPAKQELKTKRLSQVKTPDALKKKKSSATKAKKDVKSPVGTKKASTPMKRKPVPKSVKSSRPAPKKVKK